MTKPTGKKRLEAGRNGKIIKQKRQKNSFTKINNQTIELLELLRSLSCTLFGPKIGVHKLYSLSATLRYDNQVFLLPY